MTIGERRLPRVIRERREADAIYQEGQIAGLRRVALTQSAQCVYPGRRQHRARQAVDINIKYFHTRLRRWLVRVGCSPMVVGPRFQSARLDGGHRAVAGAPTVHPGRKRKVQYLKPGERSGRDISLAVAVDAGVAVEEHPQRETTSSRPAARLRKQSKSR